MRKAMVILSLYALFLSKKKKDIDLNDIQFGEVGCFTKCIVIFMIDGVIQRKERSDFFFK